MESGDPEARIRVFILNHLEYFLANQKAMKVLSHEDEVLKNGHGVEIAGHQERVRAHLRGVDGTSSNAPRTWSSPAAPRP